MASNQRSRAANVCVNCKARKKKCDKSLPTCGYCVRKGLKCQYRRPRFIPHHVRSIEGVAGNYQSLVSEPEFNPIVHPSPLHLTAAPSQSENPLSLEAQRIIRTTGRYFDEISVRYFQTVHSYVPIIARNHFHSNLISFGASQEPDFAILLLAMCLLTYRFEPRRDDTSLYLSARSLFFQAQALCKPSLRLVQAGILLAVHEYSCRSPEQALITIGGCVRMAHTAGLERPTCTPATGRSDTVERNDGSVDEHANTWWAMLIYERMFICEQTVIDQLPVSPMPEITLTSFAPDQCAFYQAAQAAWLLDRVLGTLSAPDSEDRHTRLQGLDLKLQTFLSLIIGPSIGPSTVYCWAISVAIRALFLLHGRVLDHQQDSNERSANNSHVALDTLTRIVLDIADLHQQLSPDQVEALPPSCGYIIRAALENIQHRSLEVDDEIKLLKAVDNRWGMAR
ncbi:hypothetical protein BJY00DRAFT_314756 [Aspergillus carlsbadensis]|nr:hypothetical protein BJY00DRAFT_314756 [Aspergillus carlsbadensis]